jgi:hypothetical protein
MRKPPPTPVDAIYAPSYRPPCPDCLYEGCEICDGTGFAPEPDRAQRLAEACGPITLQVWLGDHDGGTRTMTAAEYVQAIVTTLAHHEQHR